jgi:hypothetical protein
MLTGEAVILDQQFRLFVLQRAAQEDKKTISYILVQSPVH